MFLNTARVPWSVLRGEVTTTDSTTFLPSPAYNNWPSENTIKLNEAPLADANGLLIAFYGTDAANESADYILWGRSRTNGPLQRLLSGTITLGTQFADTDPIDNVTPITGGLWAKTITAIDGLFYDATNPIVKVLDSGNSRIAMLKFDQIHIDELYLEITDINTAASIYAIITGY
jgi:hypothetical protein